MLFLKHLPVKKSLKMTGHFAGQTCQCRGFACSGRVRVLPWMPCTNPRRFSSNLLNEVMYYLSYQWILNTWRKPSCLLKLWQPLARHYSPPRKSFEPFLITAGLLPNKSQVLTLKSFNTICFVLERVGISSKIEMKLLLFFLVEEETSCKCV